MTTREQLNLSQPLTDVYTAMETDLMTAIARQVAAGGEISATSEWRLKKLAEAGTLSKETVRIIASYTEIQSDLVAETIERAAMGVADRLEPALLACAKDGYISAVSGTPISEDIKNVVTNFRRQVKTDLNVVNTVMQSKANSAYKNLVNKIYDDTKRDELLGTSRQETVRNCIKEFSQKGIPAFVDKRGREWSPEAYINMDIRTAVNNTANAAQDACCDRYGLDLIQISSHMGARPKCAQDQGKLYSRSNRSGIAHDGNGDEIPFYPWSSTSYGEPDGILGINCHHKKYPFVDGVNFQKYFPYDQEENAEKYKELQKQRAMERRVRETSRQVDMLEAVGDVEGAKEARRKLREQSIAYRDYSEGHGLAVHDDKLTVVKVKNGDTSYKNIYSSGLTDSGGNGIIKDNKSIEYKSFSNGEEVNDFFYYDDEKRGLLAKKNSEYGKWLDGLSKDEKDFISWYTAGGYGDINDYWRKKSGLEDIPKDIVEKASADIDRAISRFNLKENITVQRGVKDFYGASIVENEPWNDIHEIIGKTFHDKGYGSSTPLLGNRVAASKPVLFEIEIPAGVGRGAYVNKLAGEFEDVEYEFLIARDSKFKITDVIENYDAIPNQTIIKMRMIVDE